METSITPQDVIGKDPFGRFLSFLRLKPWQAALASFTIFAVYLFALPAYFGALFPAEGLERSAIVDRVNQVGFLIIHPAVIFFYVWQAAAIADLYRLVLPLLPESARAGLLRASRILHINSRVWIVGALFGAGAVYLGALFVMDYLGVRWYSVNWFMAAVLQLSRFLLFYMILIALGRHLAMAFNLNRVYRHVKLPVMIGQSKYGASFDSITRYGMTFAIFGGALGFMIAMRFFFSTPVFPEDAVYLILYIILIPLAFFLPFWQAHIGMKLAKEEALQRISDSLQDEYDRLMPNLSSMKTAEMPSERIAALRALLDLTEKAPTWPFENWAFYRVLAATVLPFIMTGLGLLLDLLI
ncbi:MAG: hypothetical protein DCC59_00790 [Chloroflexi bacterium]|nr:hypothetical protein [Anaerolineales bacterium]RIK55424.1 MAG: hypothetical protein DCC59_00790 [Chloroflexota bacterium]